MNIGKAIYGILSGTTAVTDIVGTKIFPEIAEQETAVPFVIYQVQSVQPEDTHDGPSKLDEVRVEVICYDDAYNGAADLASAVRGALDRVRGTYNGVNVESVQFNDVDFEIEYDPRRYSQVLTFTFRIKRDNIEIALGTPITGAQLGDLSDVNVTGVTDNQILSYDAASDTWVPAADAGGPDVLDDLSDVDTGEPADGQMLAYQQGTWSAIYQDEITLPIASVTGLQAELNTIPDGLDDLDDVKILGTPAEGEALVYQSGFWSRGTAGASTLDELDDVQVPTPSSGAVLQYNGAYWAASALSIPTVPSTYYHQRYSSEAGTLRSGATETVELYYTAQADGDGLSESASSDTPTSGYDIRRKLWYAEKAQADPDTSADWTQFTPIGDNTTFNNAKAALLAYLKERTGGTVPISLKMTWEEVAQAPSFTGLLNESYGSGAEAAYSTRRLNGNVTDCMVIRRASDSTTTTIGFVDGDIDESAIETFCSGTTCTVVTWKDQSGNGNDATAASTTEEPTIYTGGAIVKQDGIATVFFDGTATNGNALIASGFGTGSSRAIYSVNRLTQNAGEGDSSYHNVYIFQESDSVTGDFLQLYTPNASDGITTNFPTNALDLSSSSVSSVKRLMTVNKTASNVSLHIDGNLEDSATGTQALEDSLSIGRFKTFGYAVMNLSEMIVYNADKSSVRTQIESNIGDYFTQNTPLLDTYSGAAAAYSLRLLDSTYTGALINVWNGTSYADIYPNVFGELDTVALAAHCGSSDGFIRYWYDQSSNGNTAAQTTTANMPKIYDGTTGVVTEGSAGNEKPAVQFDNDKLSLASTIDFITIGTVVNFDGTLANNFITSEENSVGGIWISSTTLSFDGTGTDEARYSINGGTPSTYAENHTISDYSNNQILLFANYDSGMNSSLNTIGYYNVPLNYKGTIQEIILYNSDESTDRTNIEDNINTFYNIY